MPIRRIAGAVGFLRERAVAAVVEDAVGEPGRVGELAAPRAEAEVGGLQLQRDGPAGEALLLEPPRDLFGQRAEDRA